ncbi:hypothetical protein GCM10009646_52560 [Streptomyces aureus]
MVIGMGRFAELTNKQIRRGVHRSVQALEKDIRSWIATWNTDPKPYVWTKTQGHCVFAIGPVRRSRV